MLVTKEMQYWVYILHCENNSYYTGYTNNLSRRFEQHLAGTGRCKYTRSFKPLAIACCWEVFASKSTAMQIERFIKKMPKNAKLKLIAQPEKLLEVFSCAKVGL